MNLVVFKLGPLEIRAFTAWILAGLVVSSTMILALARRKYGQRRLTPWLDVITGGVIGAIIGARIVHIGLNWAYFSVHTGEITALQNGGLDWHGALAGGLLVAFAMAPFRRVPLLPLMDTFALALPVGAAAIWLACAAANAAYGVEVRTLADFPGWLVTESPDVYGFVAPRLNLPPLGIALAVLVFGMGAVLTRFDRLRGLRLWLALIVYGLGMAVIGFFRAEWVPTWLGRRADQILDLAVALGAALILALVAVLRRRASSPPGFPEQSAVASQGVTSL